MSEVSLWRIAVDTPDYTADDVTGKGAEVTGGRWNRKGRPALYTSSTIALSCLETLAHLRQEGLPFNRFLVRVDVPSAVWAARKVAGVTDLDVGWDALPEGKVSLDYGDTWLMKADSAVLVIPSVIVPEEFNALVNPTHPLATGITATKVRKWMYDPRLLAQRRK